MSDRVVEICLKKYSELSGNGKPKEDEWTLLSGIVVEDKNNNSFELISLATGTKCIGASAMSPTGDIVNDSHAEVLARRGFLRFLYEEVDNTLKGEESKLFNLSSLDVCRLKEGIKFHLYVSHVPCGDASIIPMLNQPPAKKVKMAYEWDEVGEEINKDDPVIHSDRGSTSGPLEPVDDIHRTGSKCVLSDSRKDLKLPKVGYHTLGAVRTKPGRGDPTLSVSCSDKIAKWIYLGLQGSLLSLLIKDKLELSSVIIGGGGQYCFDSLKRALLVRSKALGITQITLRQSDITFSKSRYSSSSLIRPCPASIIWANVTNRPLEVAVNGRRLGTTNKTNRLKSSLEISKMKLFYCFNRITRDKYKGLSYGQIKSISKEYQEKFEQFKTNIGAWTEKPYLYDFLPIN